MKNKLRIIIGVGTIGVVMFVNILSGSLFKSKSYDLSLVNMKTLSVSAGEMWCDQTNSQCCKITTNGSVGESTGVLRAEF